MEMGKRQGTISMIQALQIAHQSYVTDGGSLSKTVDNHRFYLALSGAQTRNVYMSFKSSQVNPNDELIDAWGTPFQVKYASDTAVRITSAGPDEIFGTADDITGQ